MKIQAKELDLLVDIYKHLSAEGARPDLTAALLRAIERMSQEWERRAKKFAV